MKLHGSCACGYITFEAEGDPEKTTLCHCTDCQTSTGAAYRVNVPSLKHGFRLLTGQPKIYIKTTAESGNPRAQAFCPECGTPIYSTTVTDPQVHMLRVGTIRQRTELRPKAQGWFRSAQTWSQDLTALPRFEKQRPA
jgi:hypothetical protein